MSSAEPPKLDIRETTRNLCRALTITLNASYEDTETRIVSLAGAQECCRQAERAIEQLRTDSESRQKFGGSSTTPDDMN